jgi:hypothetical protein
LVLWLEPRGSVDTEVHGVLSAFLRAAPWLGVPVLLADK